MARHAPTAPAPATRTVTEIDMPFHRLIFRRMAYAIANEGMLIEQASIGRAGSVSANSRAN